MPRAFCLMLLIISIHAAREGGDGGSRHKIWDAYISIHAAREGGDAVLLYV